MVHVRPIEAADLAYLPRLATSALSTAEFFRWGRPNHAKYPEHAEWNYRQKIRRRNITPGNVLRVAIADDADTFTDPTMPRDRWPQGSWVDGVWVTDQAHLSPESRRVPEGRIIGYTIWERTWPEGAEAIREAKGRSAGVWPEDNLTKKFDRALYRMGDKYTEWIGFDHATDEKRLATLRGGAMAQSAALSEHITNAVKHTTGYITCVAVVADPLFHGRGIGTRMMHWGLQQAEREGVPIILIASGLGYHLYTKLGFESLGHPTTEGLEKETIMAFWPKGVKRIERSIKVDRDVRSKPAKSSS